VNIKPQRLTFIQSVRDYLGFVPTLDQENAINSLTDFVLSPENMDLFILSGYAGTEKRV
jgi:hypothetical protein